MEPFDAAIILGARLPAMRRRVAHGAALFHAGRVRHLLLTGGAPDGGEAEAAVMRRIALGLGVTADRIVVEDCARDTIDNVRLSLPIIEHCGWKRLVLISDGYHLPRALYVCRRFGLAVAASAAPRPSALGWLAAAAREAVALPVYVLRVERNCASLARSSRDGAP